MTSILKNGWANFHGPAKGGATVIIFDTYDEAMKAHRENDREPTLVSITRFHAAAPPVPEGRKPLADGA